MPIFSSGYPEKTSNSDEDRFLISDSIDSNKIKGTKWSTIKSSIQSYVEGFTDWITTSMLKNGAVTPDKRSGGFAIGQINMQTVGSGTVSITGLGFQPKLLRFTCGQGSTTFGEVSAATSQGVAIDSDGDGDIELQYNIGVTGRDGSGNNHSGRWQKTVAIYLSITTGGNENKQYEASVSSMDVDGFTIDVLVASTSGDLVTWEAYA